MKNDGGSAFPVSSNQSMPETVDEAKQMARGMSLRDYFAAKAMQGLIASNDGEAGDRITEIPEYAYSIADAMLVEREKEAA